MALLLEILFSLCLICPIRGQCKGSLVKDCCSGYRWNETLKECVKCLPGFFGVNCRQKCRYPSYGENCQKQCRCLKYNCNPFTGCQVVTSTSSMTTENAPKRFSYVTYANKESTEYEEHLSSDSLSFMKDPLVIGIFITIAVIILLFVFCIGVKVSPFVLKQQREYSIKKKQNTAISSRVMSSLNSLDYQALQGPSVAQTNTMRTEIAQESVEVAAVGQGQCLDTNICNMENSYEDVEDFEVYFHHYQNTKIHEKQSRKEIKQQRSLESLEDVGDCLPRPSICSREDLSQGSRKNLYLVVLPDTFPNEIES